ncbi:MAG: DUF167 domain-containing protein [Phycisphaerales bacterium]|nr:DUF167 domain-containing protein [Phycisphaerales bacterium]
MTNPPSREILVKAVPGASRDQIVGPLGDRLKVRVSAPPEGGRANKAICALIAQQLGISKSSVEVISGHSNPEKRVRIVGASAEAVAALLDAKAR